MFACFTTEIYQNLRTNSANILTPAAARAAHQNSWLPRYVFLVISTGINSVYEDENVLVAQINEGRVPDIHNFLRTLTAYKQLPLRVSPDFGS